ncbi:ABC transporter ATP-binding protein, partial [Butyricicoccus sp. 1XD8-22]
MSQQAILEVKDLKTSFHTERGSVTALHGINFQLKEGEILGIVGESGCGKSVTSQSILRLYDEKYLVDYEGEINFQGKNLLKLPMDKMQEIRGNDISMIFQDP